MEIQDLKTRITIQEVAGRLGIRIDRQGRALCPFHDDKVPSLQFSRGKNIATCFSSNCDAGTMDIIELTEKSLKLSTHEATMTLKEWAGLVPAAVQSNRIKPSESHSENSPRPAGGFPRQDETLSRIALLTKAFRYCENGLRTSKAGKEYLQSRNLIQSTPTQKGIEVGTTREPFTSGKTNT